MARIQVVTCVWRRVDVVGVAGVSVPALAFVPIPKYAATASRQFAVDAEYPIAPVEPRSRASHDHYFAALREGYLNLPERFAARFPSEDHLRYWLLIQTNWFHETEIETVSSSEAKKLAMQWRRRDSYAAIKIIGNKVLIRWAMSQNHRSMGKRKFEDSKRDVLELLAQIIGVPLATLTKEAGRSA